MKSRFPWYDSLWLSEFVRAKTVLEAQRPALLDEFVARFEPLRTRSDFKAVKAEKVLDENQLMEATEVVASLQPNELEKHEFFRMGRHVVHNHTYFTALQDSLIGFVSELAGEEVESSYNFLSMYNNLGNCSVHLDSPQAKWTLDICLEQSDIWPIHFSRVLPWPETFNSSADDWAERIKSDPKNQFSSYELEPGEAVLFSGSSQWHYRDPIAQPQEKGQFCHLAFLHYIPKGSGDWIAPETWGAKFGVPELER